MADVFFLQIDAVDRRRPVITGEGNERGFLSAALHMFVLMMRAPRKITRIRMYVYIRLSNIAENANI